MYPAAQHNWADDLAFLLYDSSRLLRRRVGERLSELGLSEAQWRVLAFLLRSEGLSQTELAEILSIQKAPLGEQLDRLEAEGWIERRKHQQDRRANRLFIPDNRLDQARIIGQRVLALVEDIKALTPANDWQDLQDLLDRLAANFASREALAALSHTQFASNLHLIGLTSRQLRKQFDHHLKSLGTSRSQWLVLSSVMYQPGIQQQQLGRHLDMAKAPLGQVLTKLVKRGWLARQPDPADRRRNQLVVVDTALPTLEAVAEQYRLRHREFDEQLGHKSLERLKQHLKHFRQTLLALAPQPAESMDTP